MKPIRFTAAVKLTATAGKPRRFEILAYTGGPLQVEGFPLPVVVDLRGVELVAGGVSVVLNHALTAETTIGQTDQIKNDGTRLFIAGPVTGEHRPLVRDAIDQAAKGHRWQASIGGSVAEIQEVPKGRTANVNGRTFNGPILVARKFHWRETSVLPVGADGSTTVNLAAAAALSLKGAATMTFDEWLKEKFDVTPEQLPEKVAKMLMEQFAAETNPKVTDAPVGDAGVAASASLNLRASRAADLERIGQIEAKYGTSHPLIAAAAIRRNLSIAETELEVLRQERRSRVPRGLVSGSGAPNEEAILQASFAMTCGVMPKYLEKELGQAAIHEAMSRQHRGARLHHCIRHFASAHGEFGNQVTDAMLRASFGGPQPLQAASGGNLVNILSNTANKLLLQGFDMVSAPWRSFCTVASLENFKPHTRYRMVIGGTYEEIGPSGKIPMGTLTEDDAYSNRLKTYGRMYALTREDLINDDLDAFASIVPGLGRTGAVTLNKSVARTLLANNATLFTVGRGNRKTGTSSALSITSLATAEEAFLRMVDGNGDYIMMEPSLLLVPPALSTTSRTLINSTQVIAVGVGSSAATTPDGNPHNAAFDREVWSWLENANLPGHSDKGWYLLAKPMGSAGLMEVGFLNGQESPTVQQADADFSTLGIQFRGFHDWGVAVQDYRFGVYSSGVVEA